MSLMNNKLKSLKVAKWRKDEWWWWMMIKGDEGWMKNDEGWWFQAAEGFWWRTDRLTDICDCRVAFATEGLTKDRTDPTNNGFNEGLF